MLKVIQQSTPHFIKHSIPRNPSAAVIHVMEGSLEGTRQWFKNPASEVSSHFGFGIRGQVHQYVPIHYIAWHAGRISSPTWKGLIAGVNPNNYTIGLEHEGSGLTEWTEEMLLASAMISWWLCNRFGWEIDGLSFPLHNEIFKKKTCPGPKFPRKEYLIKVQAIKSLFGPDITKVIKGIK